MLSFVLFEADQGEAGWAPRQVYLYGPDGLPVPSEITLERDLLMCRKPTPDAAGLSLQSRLVTPAEMGQIGDADAAGGPIPAPLGVLSLRTCLLPERDEPYLLSLELARYRLMLFLNKMEDWGLSDLPGDGPIMPRFEAARRAFTEALVAQRIDAGTDQSKYGFSMRADTLARRALAIAVDAGERLALHKATREAAARAAGTTYKAAVAAYEAATQESPPPEAAIIVAGTTGVTLPGRPALGCAVNPNLFTDEHQRAVAAACDFVSIPMRWTDLEPAEGKYAFKNTDRWIEWAVRKAKIPIVAGPVIDFRPRCSPDWLYIWENDYETLRQYIEEHLRQVVTRYRRTVARWTVASGLHVNGNFKLTFEQMMDLTRLCVTRVKKLHPTAKVQLEITQPWGEYYAYDRRSLPPHVYAEMLVQASVPVDAFGLRIQVGQPIAGQSTRDLLALSNLLDHYASVEKPIAVSVLGAPSQPPKIERVDQQPMDPGYWRAPWSEAQQAEWLGKVVGVAASKPFVQSVCWQEVGDSPAGQGCAEMPDGGLLNAAGQPKPALRRLFEIRQAMREGRPPGGLEL
jgi:hypothetical protein